VIGDFSTLFPVEEPELWKRKQFFASLAGLCEPAAISNDREDRTVCNGKRTIP